jgi:hypothetical protein
MGTFLQLLLKESNVRIIQHCVEFLEYALIRETDTYDAEKDSVEP